MATTTPTIPLALRLRERLDADRARKGDDDYGFIEAVGETTYPMTDCYWLEPIGWNDEDHPDAVEPPWVAREWLDALENRVREAARAAYDAYVVPAIIGAIVETLPSAPHELTSHPKADKLRADLAALEPER